MDFLPVYCYKMTKKKDLFGLKLIVAVFFVTFRQNSCIAGVQIHFYHIELLLSIVLCNKKKNFLIVTFFFGQLNFLKIKFTNITILQL